LAEGGGAGEATGRVKQLGEGSEVGNGSASYWSAASGSAAYSQSSDVGARADPEVQMGAMRGDSGRSSTGKPRTWNPKLWTL